MIPSSFALSGIQPNDIALLLARVLIGVVFMAHGAQKLFGAFGGAGLSTTVKHMGPVGYLVTIGEFFGGLGLIVGFLSRFSAGALIVVMLGAIYIAHRKAGFFMNWMGDKKGEGYEFHLIAIGLLLVILIGGPGQLAIAQHLY
jgi:putative oxidoreductase